MKRAREREREKERTESRSSLSSLFVSLESFPLPPLEETAAPATQTCILQLIHLQCDDVKYVLLSESGEI